MGARTYVRVIEPTTEMTEYWTNDSVLRFAQDRDPVAVVEDAAQQLVLDAVEHEWHGPPFDPFELARILGIPVVPMQELRDARTVPAGGSFHRVQPHAAPAAPPVLARARDRAHPLPRRCRGCSIPQQPRSRPHRRLAAQVALQHRGRRDLDANGEPAGAARRQPRDERLVALRREYGVSTEALLRRATKLSARPVAMFAASRTDPQRVSSSFRIDYAVPSRAWQPEIHRGQRRPADSVLAECTAVGFTAKRHEDWSSELPDVEVQAVGAPPFPEQRYPRVLGLLRPRGVRAVSANEIAIVHGDATQPRGRGLKVIAHLVNDKTPNWGGAFARAVRTRYPIAQDDFRAWTQKDSTRLTLGAVHIGEPTPEIRVATMVAQHGYGQSASPRDPIRRTQGMP